VEHVYFRPSGLSINSGSGLINLAGSTPNTYSITYSIGGTCPNTYSASLYHYIRL